MYMTSCTAYHYLRKILPFLVQGLDHLLYRVHMADVHATTGTCLRLIVLVLCWKFVAQTTLWCVAFFIYMKQRNTLVSLVVCRDDRLTSKETSYQVVHHIELRENVDFLAKIWYLMMSYIACVVYHRPHVVWGS